MKSIGRLGVVIAVLASLGGVGLHAQGLALGVKAGGTLGTVKNAEDASSKWGVAGGAFLGVGLGGLRIQPELWYVQKRADDATGASFKQDFIEIPLLIGTSFGVGIKPFIYVAPILSFETTCSLSTESLSESCTDLSLDSESTQFAGAIGAGLTLGIFSIDVRYALGFTNIFSGDDSDSEKWNTLYILGGAGLSLGL